MRRYAAFLFAIIALACTGAYTALGAGPYTLTIIAPTATMSGLT